jgi:hypothetical protein
MRYIVARRSTEARATAGPQIGAVFRALYTWRVATPNALD